MSKFACILLGFLIGLGFGYYWHYAQVENYVVPQINEITKELKLNAEEISKIKSDLITYNIRIRNIESKLGIKTPTRSIFGINSSGTLSITVKEKKGK